VSQAERKLRSHEAEVQAYQHDWQQHVLRLKTYFERQGLQNVDPSGEQGIAIEQRNVIALHQLFLLILCLQVIGLKAHIRTIAMSPCSRLLSMHMGIHATQLHLMCSIVQCSGMLCTH